MPHDPARVGETREWLQKASLDLRGAQIDLAADPPLLEDALFHCQQTVEKTLKAFLAWHDQPFRKTHSLEELGTADHPMPTVDEARQGLATAVRVVEGVMSRLPSEAVPPALLNPNR